MSAVFDSRVSGAPVFSSRSDVSSSASIDSLGADGKVRIGSVNSITTSLLGTLTTASTIDGVAITSASAPDGDGTITPAGFVNGEISYAAMGESVTCIVTDGEDSAQVDRELDTYEGWEWIDVVGMDTGPWSLGQAFGDDIPLQVHVPLDAVTTLYPNLTGDGWTTAKFNVWARMSEGTYPEGTMILFTVKSVGSGGAAGFIRFIEPIGFIM